MSNEANMRICKICNVLKLRVYDEKFNEKDRRWRDDTGRLWNGNVCGICNVERSRNNMKRLRVKS